MGTNDLRKLIQSRLKEICENVFFETADNEKLYPHIVYSYETVNLDDLNRKDYIIDINLWDKDSSAVRIEDMTDIVERVFNNQNLPQDTILPTFYKVDRKIIPDEDKKIRHRLVRILVQNYER